MSGIILASASPRRRELMQRAGIPCVVLPCDADETLTKLVPPEEAVQIISARKAAIALKAAPPSALIVAADTAVSIDGLLLGKPKDAEEALAILKRLQGRRHTVYTGVTLCRAGSEEGFYSFYDRADVFIRALSDEEIMAYIATGEPFDKAGAYGIQDKGSLLVERIEGDYHTVVGLPLTKLYLALVKWGIRVTDFWWETE